MMRSNAQRRRFVSRPFTAQLNAWQDRIETALAARLPAADAVPAHLHRAIRSSVLGRGTRTHSILMFAIAQTVGAAEDQIEAAACALELIKLSATVHDALPALGRDDEQSHEANGCDEAYDEATVLLVGDALPSLAFALLSVDPALPQTPSVRLELAIILAGASGTLGGLGEQWRRYRSAADNSLGAALPRSDRTLYRASVRMAIACVPSLDSALSLPLAEFETAVGMSWSDACAVLPKFGSSAKPLRRVTEWLAAQEPEISHECD